MGAKQTQEEKNWQATQNELAERGGSAIVIADENSPDLAESNNNSICRVLYNSEDFAPECAKFCGRAFEWANKAGKAIEYKCYAGLNCLAIPVKTETKQLVAIVGRTFLKAEDYRNATERAISGDWQKFPPTKFFDNVLLSGSPRNLEATAKRIENLSRSAKAQLAQFIAERGKNEVIETPEIAPNKTADLAEPFYGAVEPAAIVSEEITRAASREAEEISEWRSLLGSLLEQSYRQACESILRFVRHRYSVTSLAWLERRENRLETVFAGGQLKEQAMRLSISADDLRLLDAVRREISLELRERQTTAETLQPQKTSKPQTVRLFPVAVGGEIRSALIVADEIADETKSRISRFCQTIAAQLEILRLREELRKRGWLDCIVRKFNETVKDLDADDFLSDLARISAELMRAERASLLIFDEKSNSLSAKAATGARADIIKREHQNLGARIALKVLQHGKPLLVEDVRKIEINAAPVEYSYKSNSFISCPITIGRRKIGVLNVTDRAGGESFGELDLIILNAIMPHLAVLLDRALLKRKAGEFEQLSVTDALTGLLNRMYMDERLPEEIRRSNREGFPMSFLAIDVDDFKSYNDNFGHPEGDKALKLVAHCLKDTLRGADVAARYGGEEFAILLPQTTSAEALIIGERIRERVASTEFPNRKVTISVGVASCTNVVCTAPEIIKAADDALYEAKRQGRNNVRVFENLSDGER